MLKQQLQQKLQQKLSPQQIQLIRLLELPAIELEERIKHELEENPALDEGSVSESETDLALGDYLSEEDIPDYKLQEIRGKAEQKEDIPFSVSQSLNEFLLQQIGLRELPETEMKIAEYIIGNIDDDGYLRRDLEAIADDLIFQAGQEVTIDQVKGVLLVIQDLEPIGVAARNLQECLLIQLEKGNNNSDCQLAIRVLKEYFDEFTRKHYDKIVRGLQVDEESLKKAIHEITSLNPKPGAAWGDSMVTVLSQVLPDFLVEASNGELILTMNNRGIPEMRINKDYAAMLKNFDVAATIFTFILRR